MRGRGGRLAGGDWRARPPEQLAPFRRGGRLRRHLHRSGRLPRRRERLRGRSWQQGGRRRPADQLRGPLLVLRPARVRPPAAQRNPDGSSSRRWPTRPSYPVRTDWGGGFSDRQQKGLDSLRWAVMPDPTLTLDNPSDGGSRRPDLFVKLTRAGEARGGGHRSPRRTTERVEVPPGGSGRRERPCAYRPGTSRSIQLAIHGGGIDAPAGVPSGYLELLGVAAHAGNAAMSASISPTSTPTSAHASGVTVSPARAARASAFARVHPAHLVQVRRAHRRDEVRVAVAVQRHRPGGPQLVAQQRQQLLQRLRARPRCA